MHDLIIDDDTNVNQKQQIKALADILETAIDVFIEKLGELMETGIMAGKAHESIAELKSFAEELEGNYSKLSAAIYLAFDNFKADTDKADRFLYDT